MKHELPAAIAATLKADDHLLTSSEVCAILRVSKAWLFSPSGKATVGPGLKLGGSRRFRTSAIAKVLRADDEALA